MSINFVTLVTGEIMQVRAGGRLRNSIIIPVVAHFRLKAISYEAIISYCSVYANIIFKTMGYGLGRSPLLSLFFLAVEIF